jgi:hypothetical protein
MKTIELARHLHSVDQLLSMARDDVVLLTTESGESFVLSSADDFATEVQLLRRNQAFLAKLDELKKDDRTISLEEAENKLR